MKSESYKKREEELKVDQRGNDMDKKCITVTMSMYDYEQLESKADDFDRLIRMLERANQDGKAIMTDELKVKIEEIYCQINPDIQERKKIL